MTTPLDAPIEQWKGRKILFVTPHPDDDTFCAGGTLALLARGGNDIEILIYTSDNAGSNDPTMTKARLAEIRKREEEEACRIVGIPASAITWLGYDDGMLEYADRLALTRQIAGEIRRRRPDAVFTIDPGAVYDQYHKSDHRSAAIVTADAMRAANWRLYFPELEAEGLAPWSVPVAVFYYSADPNCSVDITGVVDLKLDACAAHTSQHAEWVTRYDPNPPKAKIDELKKSLRAWDFLFPTEDGKVVEKFRRATGYGE